MSAFDELLKRGTDYLYYCINEREALDYLIADEQAKIDTLEGKKHECEVVIERYDAMMDLIRNKDGISFNDVIEYLTIHFMILDVQESITDLDNEIVERQHTKDDLLDRLSELDETIRSLTDTLESQLERQPYGHVFGIESKADEERVYKGLF